MRLFGILSHELRFCLSRLEWAKARKKKVMKRDKLRGTRRGVTLIVLNLIARHRQIARLCDSLQRFLPCLYCALIACPAIGGSDFILNFNYMKSRGRGPGYLKERISYRAYALKVGVGVGEGDKNVRWDLNGSMSWPLYMYARPLFHFSLIPFINKRSLLLQNLL